MDLKQQLVIVSMWVAAALFVMPGNSRAEAPPPDSLYVSADAMPKRILREVIGVATVQNTVGPWRLPVRARVDAKERFLSVDEVAAVSGWDYQGQFMRRFPVMRQEGANVEVVLNVRTGERGWLRAQGSESNPQSLSVTITRFDSSLKGQFIRLFPSDKVRAWKLFTRPEDGTPAQVIGPGDATPNEELQVLAVEGGFAQIAPFTGWDEPPAKPLGWVRIRDEQGRLAVWLDLPPGC